MQTGGRNRGWGQRLGALATLALWPCAASALVADVSANDNVDDATIEVHLDASVITGDVRSRCSIHLDVGSDEVVFSDGDHVYVWLYEDDLMGDDVIWATDFAVNPGADVVNGHLVRDYDCSANLGADGVGTMEVYAEARVEKSECGWLCAYDDPETSNIALGEVEDDGNEEDDASGAAHDLVLGDGNRDRVARDQDWQSVDLQSRSRVSLRVRHAPHAGRLDVALFDGAGQQVAVGADEPTETVLVHEPLDAGTWYFRVSPRQGDDFNFYDLTFNVDTLAGECSPNDTHSQDCGNCGTQFQTCDVNGRWTPFGPCGDEGACAPGSTRDSSCGRCGALSEACGADCQWGAPTACAGEGVCEPGAEDTADCPEGGTHVRSCGDDCQWGAFGECGDSECEAGDTRECYTGPQGTRSVGTCRPGAQSCVGGRWGGCEGQVVPIVEECADNLDNDCDGDVDGEDDSCSGEPQFGDPCATDGDCGQGQSCLTAPDHPQFTGGYCGAVPCQEDCGDAAACVSLFGHQYCLRNCAADRDCRPGYRCLEVQVSDRVCAPPCTGDDDCADPRKSECDVMSGLCVAAGSPPAPDAGTEPSSPPTQPPTAGPSDPPTEPPPVVGQDAGGLTGADAGDAGLYTPGSSGGNSTGCVSAAPGRTAPQWLLVPVALLLAARRRRSRR